MTNDFPELTIAILGAGPSGIFAAADILRKLPTSTVDIYDRLPAPYGLLRYGVAPDHLKMKTLENKLRKTLDDPRVRFVGNVEYGTSLRRAELEDAYNAVIVSAGCPHAHVLGIEGEDLNGSFSAAELVSWYNGHPDAPADFDLVGQNVVVVGAGNVALDVSRVLLKGSIGLRKTDVPDHVLVTLDDRMVSNVTVLSRGGVAQAKFTVAELMEFESMDDVDIIVDPVDVQLSPADMELYDRSPQLRLTVDTFVRWSQTPVRGSGRSITFRFRSIPMAINGGDRVRSVSITRAGRQQLDDASTEQQPADIAADMVFSAVGYRGKPLPGLPFDVASGVIPNTSGRIDGLGTASWYVTGWLKRGPTGVIGTNKACSAATVDRLVEDIHAGRILDASKHGFDAIKPVLAERNNTATDWSGWQRIRAAEETMGQLQGRDRAKIASLEQLMAEATRAVSAR